MILIKSPDFHTIAMLSGDLKTTHNYETNLHGGKYIFHDSIGYSLKGQDFKIRVNSPKSTFSKEKCFWK